MVEQAWLRTSHELGFAMGKKKLCYNDEIFTHASCSSETESIYGWLEKL